MSNRNKPLIAATDYSFTNKVTTLYIGREGEELCSDAILSVTGDRALSLRSLFAEDDRLGTLNIKDGSPSLSHAPSLQCIRRPVTDTRLPYIIEDRGDFVRNRYMVMDPEGLELCVTKDFYCAQAVWTALLRGNELGFGLWTDEDTKRYLTKKEGMES